MRSELHVTDIEKAIKAVKNHVQLVYINGQLYWLFDKEGKPMASLRRDRSRAAKAALGEMSPRAAARAVGKAEATGRVFPTSGQRGRAKKRSK